MGKYAIDMGHTLTGLGTGATGFLKETDVNRAVGKKLIAMLREKGHIVYDCTVDRSSNDLADRVNLANATNADFFLSIHLNAFGTESANGTETFIYSGGYPGKENNRAIAKRINDAVVSYLGTTNRGVKEANYYVLRGTVMPAALVELFFITNRSDCNKYNINKLAEALFLGLTGTKYTVTTGGSTSKYSTGLYKVNTDILNVRKEPNTSSKIVTTVKQGDVYTITDVVKNDGYNFGKLKSCLGYIALEYCIKM